MKHTTLLTCALILSGCSLTPPGWYIPAGRTMEQFQRDQYQCTLDARMSQEGYVDYSVFNECMRVHGYTPAPRPR